MTAWLETRRVLTFVVALGLFAMAARHVTDPDVWWHLRTGELIAQTHAFVHSDPYSFTRHGEPWVNHEWLSDLLLYGLYRIGGWPALILVFAAFTAATFMLIFARCPGRPYFAALALVLGAYAAAPGWGVRPHTISLLLASVFLLALERSEANPRALWWTLPLTVVWVNLHAEYALGIALIAMFLAGEAIEAMMHPREATPRRRLRDLAIALLGCLAVVPLNPNGTQMYFYPFATLRSVAMQQYIAEWSSPNFHEARYLPFAFLLLAMLILFGSLRPTTRPRDLLLLLVTTAGALRSVRHISAFVLIAVPILSGLAERWWHQYRPALSWPETRSSRRMVFNALILASLAGFASVRVHKVIREQSRSERENFPGSAATFLLANHCPGPIFNHYNFGGYFIWNLYPRYPVFIDGRADLYGDQFLHDFARTYYLTDPKWDQPLDQWNIQTVVLPPDAPLLAALKLGGAWTQVYADPLAVVLTRAPKHEPRLLP